MGQPCSISRVPLLIARVALRTGHRRRGIFSNSNYSVCPRTFWRVARSDPRRRL